MVFTCERVTGLKMKLIIAVFCLLLAGVNSMTSNPKVQVYSQAPGEFGQKNTLICYVSGFHPPDISISLLKDGVEIPGGSQSDLAFESSWQFHLTKRVPFVPQSGEEYTCRVKHQEKTNNHVWDPDM